MFTNLLYIHPSEYGLETGKKSIDKTSLNFYCHSRFEVVVHGLSVNKGVTGPKLVQYLHRAMAKNRSSLALIFEPVTKDSSGLQSLLVRGNNFWIFGGKPK